MFFNFLNLVSCNSYNAPLVMFWKDYKALMFPFNCKLWLPSNSINKYGLLAFRNSFFEVENMVRITEELVRKKSEHNECEIGTLEELSLHQEDIEKIEHLQNWCRNLEILLLQSNLIPKIDKNYASENIYQLHKNFWKLLKHLPENLILNGCFINVCFLNLPENLGKLKKLQYLNMALNNVQRIENLEKLESLEKLDLTLNFIGELTSVQNLKGNYNLKYLFLTGNPCTDYKGYREYVITVLPQLLQLDGVEITRSERIVANQDFDEFERSIKREEEKYLAKTASNEAWAVGSEHSSEESDVEMTEEQLKEFWASPSQNTPKDRVSIAKKSRKVRDVDRKHQEKKKKPKPVKLFTSDGRPLNINQGRIPFTLVDDDETGCKILDVAAYRHLDTSLIDVDLHPRYVTITIKGKILQITFDDDIAVDKSTCQRSQTTGHLVVTMQKANALLKPKPPPKKEKPQILPPARPDYSKRQYLEIGPADNEMDFSRIVENNKSRETTVKPTPKKVPEKIPPPDFVDNDEVPPLM